MTLLTDIIEGAAGDASTATLLRKLKIVAARTGTIQLAEWVDHELNGYPPEAPIPDYRGPFRPHVLGHFIGPFGTEAKNMPIPPISFEKKLQDSALFVVELRESVAEIEDLSNEESRNYAWTADAVEYYNYGVNNGTIRRIMRPGMGLVNASRPIPRQIFIGVLEGVRNRALDLALGLERTAPEAGQLDAKAGTEAQAAAVINNYNFNASSNVAISSSDFKQQFRIAAGDEEALMRTLKEAGIPDSGLAELHSALEQDSEDPESFPSGRPGNAVMTWIAKTTAQIGAGAARTLVTEAIKAYFAS